MFTQHTCQVPQVTQGEGATNISMSSNDESIQVVDKNDLFEFNPDLELEEIIQASQSDVDYFSWNISASPISFSRVPDTKDLGYSVSISCLVCEDTSIDFLILTLTQQRNQLSQIFQMKMMPPF